MSRRFANCKTKGALRKGATDLHIAIVNRRPLLYQRNWQKGKDR